MKGVLLANTGSPASPDPDSIELYLRSYLMDERIRQLPKFLWKWLVFKHILPKRKYASSERYQFIWTEDGSPLVVNARVLAEKVQRLFGEESDVVVRSAMSYGSPSIGEALSELRELGVDSVVLLPMYPQSAYSPTMAVIDAFHRAQDSIGWHPESTIINNYHDDAGYIALMVQGILDAGFQAESDDRIVLSFHAIPLKDEKAGDTYRAQIAESKRLIAEGLGVSGERITTSFQSVFGHDESKWTSPLSRDVLKGWRDESFAVVYACPGFSIDCLETLYDIPHEMVPALEGDGAAPVVTHSDGDVQASCNTCGRFRWVRTLNTSDEHAAMLKAILDKSMS